MIVSSTVAVAVSEQDHGIVQQRFVSFLNRLHLLQEVGKLLHNVVVDLADLVNFFLVARMVGEPMVFFGNADFADRCGGFVLRRRGTC